MAESSQVTPDNVIMEIDATPFLDVIHKYILGGPQSEIQIPIGSSILCSKAMPDGTIAVWARRPIAEDAPLCTIGVWVFGTGEPLPKEGLTYLDTVIMVQQSKLVTPGIGPQLLVWHVFLVTDSLVSGDVRMARA